MKAKKNVSLKTSREKRTNAGVILDPVLFARYSDNQQNTSSKMADLDRAVIAYMYRTQSQMTFFLQVRADS